MNKQLLLDRVLFSKDTVEMHLLLENVICIRCAIKCALFVIKSLIRVFW